MSLDVAQNLVAGVVRELRFVERALLADEPALACSHLTTAADLLRAAQGSVAATAALRVLDRPTADELRPPGRGSCLDRWPFGNYRLTFN